MTIGVPIGTPNGGRCPAKGLLLGLGLLLLLLVLQLQLQGAISRQRATKICVNVGCNAPEETKSVRRWHERRKSI